MIQQHTYILIVVVMKLKLDNDLCVTSKFWYFYFI